jgi:hypothetical protein
MQPRKQMREKENNRILVEEDTRIMCTKNRRQEVQVGIGNKMEKYKYLS